MMLRRLRDEQAGASLVLALLFLVLFGGWIAAILGFADANVRATRHLREQRAITYAASGATDGAIQVIRGHATAGWWASSCPDYSTTLNALTVTVACTPETEPLHLDRTVRFVATVDGKARVDATVIYRDSTKGSGAPVTDVIAWRYIR